MPENNCLEKVFEKNLYDPMEDMKVGFQSDPYIYDKEYQIVTN